MSPSPSSEPLLCSACFRDQGLVLYSYNLGAKDDTPCPNCSSREGRKLDHAALNHVAHRFFVWGTLLRREYGAAPRLQYNEHQSTDVDVPHWLVTDIEMISAALNVGFFNYGPRLWMIGYVEPLEDLQREESRHAVIDRIISEYPKTVLRLTDILYRLRINPRDPHDLNEFDSPPSDKLGTNRLDTKGLPVLYASADLETCVHECRAVAEDELFFATLSPQRELRLLNLTHILQEDGVTEFESLDMAVHMLFLAGDYSYEITRHLAKAASDRGYDGIVYPSYFSLLRTGGMPFETGFGLSLRRIPGYADHEQAKMVSNVAIFHRPIEQGVLKVKCVNRIILRRVRYEFHFGPLIGDVRQAWTTDVGEA